MVLSSQMLLRIEWYFGCVYPWSLWWHQRHYLGCTEMWSPTKRKPCSVRYHTMCIPLAVNFIQILYFAATSPNDRLNLKHKANNTIQYTYLSVSTLCSTGLCSRNRWLVHGRIRSWTCTIHSTWEACRAPRCEAHVWGRHHCHWMQTREHHTLRLLRNTQTAAHLKTPTGKMNQWQWLKYQLVSIIPGNVHIESHTTI